MPLTSLLGAGIAMGITAFTTFHWFGGKVLSLRVWLISSSVLGAIVGLLAVPMTFALMVFKNVQHSHYGAPDFPNETLLGIWERLPFWGIAGALLGLAWGLWYFASDASTENSDEAIAA